MAVLDALELELRQLPGVVGVGLDRQDEALVVHLFVNPDNPWPELRRRASEVGRSHADVPVIIEISAVGASAAAPVAEPGHERGRVQLLAVRLDDADREVEVHLANAGVRTVGRADLSAPSGPVEATLDALDALGAHVPFRPAIVASVTVAGDHVVVVALEDAEEAGNQRLGVARSRRVEESAARATLHALNRYLSGERAFGSSGIWIQPV